MQISQEMLAHHIGERIKLYRKNKNMAAKELAAHIHKSTSAVSKYEGGEIAIDVVTLIDIADVLGVSLEQLTDIDKSPGTNSGIDSLRGFFSRGSNYYAYFINGKNRIIVKNIMEIHADDLTAVFYSHLTEYSNKYNCRHLFYGTFSSSDSYTNFAMQNQAFESEKLYMVVPNPFDQSDIAYGIISGIAPRNMLPISFKVMISSHPLPESDEMREKLILTKKEISDIRKYNNFSIDLRE